ncbi:hypothetical protein GOODEAATRI_000045, partial [Goodea atripinnis]
LVSNHSQAETELVPEKLRGTQAEHTRHGGAKQDAPPYPPQFNGDERQGSCLITGEWEQKGGTTLFQPHSAASDISCQAWCIYCQSLRLSNLMPLMRVSISTMRSASNMGRVISG